MANAVQAAPYGSSRKRKGGLRGGVIGGIVVGKDLVNSNLIVITSLI